MHEERRLRVDSTPTGKLNEQFDSMFWQASPYNWPVIGWPSDLEGITREEALEFFSIYYAPNNITAAIVGDFDAEQAKAWAQQYFGRLQRGAAAPEPVRTREVAQQAEKRMTGYAETRPTVRLRYHTVADAHADEPPLLVLSALLNGRTGRLYKSLVLEQKVAAQAGAGVNGLKFDGYFELSGVAAPRPHSGGSRKRRCLRRSRSCRKSRSANGNCRKSKTSSSPGDFRKLRSKFGLMMQLLSYEALGEWENINLFSDRIQAVTAEDVQRVAKKYFFDTNKNVAIYYTKNGATPGRGRRPGSASRPGGAR